MVYLCYKFTIFMPDNSLGREGSNIDMGVEKAKCSGF